MKIKKKKMCWKKDVQHKLMSNFFSFTDASWNMDKNIASKSYVTKVLIHRNHVTKLLAKKFSPVKNEWMPILVECKSKHFLSCWLWLRSMNSLETFPRSCAPLASAPKRHLWSTVTCFDQTFRTNVNWKKLPILQIQTPKY